MRHPRIIIASLSLAAAAALGGGITAAAATTSHASSQPAASQQAAATVRTVQATVGGKTETVLVNGAGLPLYYYLNDTAAKPNVTGALASLWPPLTSASPAVTGITGQLAAVKGHPSPTTDTCSTPSPAAAPARASRTSSWPPPASPPSPEPRPGQHHPGPSDQQR